MSLNVGTLVANLTMSTVGFTTGLAKAQIATKKGVNTIGGTLSKLKVPILAVGAALAGIGVVAINAAMDFEKAFTEVFTLLPGRSAEFYTGMTAQARNFAKEYGVTLEDLSNATYQAISAGVAPENVFDFLRIAQKAAVGGVTDLNTAVMGLSSVINAYKSESVDANKVSNVMFTTVKLGITTFEALSSSLFNVIPTAAELGVSIEEIGAAMSTMTSQGVPTKIATTQLRQMFVELNKETQVGAKNFKRLSGVSFKDFLTEGGSVAEALKMLSDDAEANNKSLMDMFGSVEAGNAALSLSGRNVEKYQSDLAEMMNASGAVDEAFNTMEKTFARRMEKLNAKVAGSMVDLGNALIPIVETTIGAIESVHETYNNKMDEILARNNRSTEDYLENNKKIVNKMEPIWAAAWDKIIETIANKQGRMLSINNLFADVILGNWDNLGEDIHDIMMIHWTSLLDLFGVNYFDFMMMGINFFDSFNSLVTQGLNFTIGLYEGAINGIISAYNAITSISNDMFGTNFQQKEEISITRLEAPKIEVNYESLAASGIMSEEALERKKKGEELAALMEEKTQKTSSVTSDAYQEQVSALLSGTDTTSTSTSTKTGFALLLEQLESGAAITTLSDEQMDFFKAQATQTTSAPYMTEAGGTINLDKPSAEALAAQNLIASHTVYQTITINGDVPDPGTVLREARLQAKQQYNQSMGSGA